MLDQNLKNVAATHNSANKSVDEMSFSIDESIYKVKVVKIDPNGSCLFGSVSHQLIGCELNSTAHKEAASTLRERAVSHIKDNFDSYFHDLKGRVEEQSKKKIDASAIEGECHVFLNACLPLKTCFGGYECIRAISEIEEVNIITISEEGDCYMAVDFDPNFKQSIFLSLRLAASVSSKSNGKIHNNNRNHYDSVFEIEKEVLLKIAELLSEREKRKAENKDKTNITLD